MASSPRPSPPKEEREKILWKPSEKLSMAMEGWGEEAVTHFVAAPLPSKDTTSEAQRIFRLVARASVVCSDGFAPSARLLHIPYGGVARARFRVEFLPDYCAIDGSKTVILRCLPRRVVACAPRHV